MAKSSARPLWVGGTRGASVDASLSPAHHLRDLCVVERQPVAAKQNNSDFSVPSNVAVIYEGGELVALSVAA